MCRILEACYPALSFARCMIQHRVLAAYVSRSTLWADALPLCLFSPAEAQEFKKEFEDAAESNSKLINMAAVPTAGGDGSADAAEQLADELDKAKVVDNEAAGEATEQKTADAKAK
eukprot:GHRR01032735.1.p2 GENE.GHRR01032735.1~~GHRR01032735.1.p2  ORF type:complete len:116 (-),score=49.55 GHRR01032735.1:186-533(-)